MSDEESLIFRDGSACRCGPSYFLESGLVEVAQGVANKRRDSRSDEKLMRIHLQEARAFH